MNQTERVIILINNRWDERGEYALNEENIKDISCSDPPVQLIKFIDYLKLLTRSLWRARVHGNV